MKTKPCLIIFLFMTLFSLHPQQAKTQFWDWEDKIPLTDSVSDNTNPDLVHIFSQMNGEMVAMAWEKSTDDTTTAIYFRDLLDPSTEQEVISIPGVNFKHPKILSLYDNNTSLFYLFFESDQNGNRDLYYMKYGVDGQFTGPFAFMTGEADEYDLNPANEDMWFLTKDGRYAFSVLAWISNGDLYNCDVEFVEDTIGFTAPLLLDTGSCYEPVVANQDLIFYLKENNDSSFIYSVSKVWPTYEWGSPEVFFDEGDCFNLAGDQVTPQYLTWSSDSSGIFRNHIALEWAPYDGYRIGPESAVPLDPAICTIVIGVSPEPWEFYDFYMAFPYTDSVNQEIFLNPFGNSYFEDFSQSGVECRNPGFFLGENHPWNWWCFYVYLVWEEMRSGHWQIMSSKTIMCVGGIDEEAVNDEFLTTWPNPFRDEINLNYTLFSEEFITVEVFDLYGRKIKEVYSGFQEEGKHDLTWNAKELPAGIYFIRLKTSDFQSSLKIIKVN